MGEKQRILSGEELKSVSLSILIHFDKFCKQHDIRYWLAYGTLLGAARHNGFIPWDDDIDVMMPMEDYRKLLSIAKSNSGLFDENYRIASTSIDYPESEHHIWYPRIYDTRTKCLWGAWFNSNIAPEQGVWIDVFPIFGVNTNIDQSLAAELKHLQQNIETCFTVHSPRRNVFAYAKESFERRRITRNGIQHWLKQYEDLILKQPDFASSTHCVDPTFPMLSYETKWFSNSQQLAFENNSFPVPNNYEEVLSSYYGDWKKLPPEEERHQTHDCTFVWNF